MSRERDLLQTALGILEDYEWGYGGDHHKSPEASILNDIRKLLAEPEEEPKFNFDLERMKAAIESPISDVTVDDLAKHVKQEPVAWMYDHQIEVGHDKYTEVNIIETCARNLESNNCINIRPLYLAPPKREPFEPEERQRLSKAYSTRAEQVAFEEGIIFAEISYSIGGGE